MQKEDLKFPHNHWHILEAMEALADPKQYELWHNPTPKMSIYDTFDETINFLGDIGIGRGDARQMIGESLRTEREAKAVNAFNKLFRDVFDDVGNGKGMDAYLIHPSWPELMEAAKLVAKHLRSYVSSDEV